MKRRLFTPPKILSAGTPDLPQPKIKDFHPGTPDLPHRKYFRRGPRICPTRKIKDFSRGDPGIPRAPHASVLTALRHKCRSFTVHAAESAGIAMGLCPIPPCEGVTPSRSRVAIRAADEPTAAKRRRATITRGLRRGSTSNEITSCQATSRSEFSLSHLRKRIHRVQRHHASTPRRTDALI